VLQKPGSDYAIWSVSSSELPVDKSSELTIKHYRGCLDDLAHVSGLLLELSYRSLLSGLALVDEAGWYLNSDLVDRGPELLL
jgi:hypothetical protein